MISKELQEKLDIYEQVYFSLDKPVPFKQGLNFYPVLVEDYYNFYACFPCLTMDKNVKIVLDELGREQKVANPQGIAQSYLAYLLDSMEDPNTGDKITLQLTSLLELVFHIKKGFYCPKCHKELSVEEVISLVEKEVQEAKLQAEDLYSQQFSDGQVHKIPDKIIEDISNRVKMEALETLSKCECGEVFRENFMVKKSGPIKKLVIRDVEISPQEFEEIKALIPRQNILDYDADKYMDPDLKEELEIKARLQNKDYTSPTLEKQMVCVAVGTGFSFEYLQKITMRKLSLLLKTVDAKNMYYAQVQASMSGMVKFKEDPKHWIFTDNKKNIKDELTSLEAFEKKFEHVT